MQEKEDYIPENILEDAALKFKEDCVSQIFLWAICIAINFIALILRISLELRVPNWVYTLLLLSS